MPRMELNRPNGPIRGMGLSMGWAYPWDGLIHGKKIPAAEVNRILPGGCPAPEVQI